MHKDNTACGFGFHGLLVHKNLKGCGISLEAESTLSSTPSYSGCQTLPFSLLETCETFRHQALCWDPEMSLTQTLPQSSHPFYFGKQRHNDQKPLLQGQKARRCWNLGVNPDALVPEACPFLEGADICTRTRRMRRGQESISGMAGGRAFQDTGGNGICL